MNEKLDIAIRRYLERELRDYEKNKAYIEELRLDIIEASPSPELGMPSSPNRGNEQQTSKVDKLINNNQINRLERVTKSIYKVLEGLNEEQYNFYVRYFQRGHGKCKVCLDMPISERTFERYKRRVVYALARELGYL